MNSIQISLDPVGSFPCLKTRFLRLAAAIFDLVKFLNRDRRDGDGFIQLSVMIHKSARIQKVPYFSLSHAASSLFSAFFLQRLLKISAEIM